MDIQEMIMRSAEDKKTLEELKEKVLDGERKVFSAIGAEQFRSLRRYGHCRLSGAEAPQRSEDRGKRESVWKK